MTACLGTQDLKQRLACYDGLGTATSTETTAAASDTAEEYPKIDLVQLKADRDKLLGRGVATRGRLNVSGQFALLRTPEIDNAPLWVNLLRLPSEELREVRSRCTSSCTVFILGKIVHVAMGIGLAAEEISVRSSKP